MRGLVASLVATATMKTKGLIWSQLQVNSDQRGRFVTEMSNQLINQVDVVVTRRKIGQNKTRKPSHELRRDHTSDIFTVTSFLKVACRFQFS